ncbi:hypothetical protein [Nostoc sp. DedQUE07]|uniref:hypothetical protein n=1 Tax=Nostoc sp. DedQUE07 TaxID=3075392 RepID=UPI00391DAF4B
MFVLWTPYRSIHCGSKSDRDRNYLSTIKGDRFSVYNLNKSDVFDRLRLHPHFTSKQEYSRLEQERSHLKQKRSHLEQEHFHLKQERSRLEQKHFHLKQKRSH